jgi:hypothetical protein
MARLMKAYVISEIGYNQLQMIFVVFSAKFLSKFIQRETQAGFVYSHVDKDAEEISSAQDNDTT